MGNTVIVRERERERERERTDTYDGAYSDESDGFSLFNRTSLCGEINDD